jgi:hypothetical protein
MAKILKPPTAGDWCYEFTCKSKWCGATIQAFPDDIRVGEFDGSYCESGTMKFYAPCACCEEVHIIPDKEIPPKVQRMAYAKRNQRD